MPADIRWRVMKAYTDLLVLGIYVHSLLLLPHKHEVVL